ncbi:hypothetical protein DMB66_17680 [Actinoplanes sp. ATCC 53533]|uniref:HAD domain-containing protein n=1 Tax=Actinoplanes sp. ATCC 53533 TaxID=1288362 RepID=UPI000F78E0C6|nr:HAD domain-containing protein [Actinoplanes sp. ATCC 53533]RSM65107.1 hypothetical protein DMB66_17680 [Actinoplanes sp. ATCC 53533]
MHADPASPVVAVDVDGVLNPGAGPASEQFGYRPHRYDGPSPAGEHVTGTLWLHPQHGDWLRELTSRGVLLVWNTSWGPLAASRIGPRLGLPADLPVIEHRYHGVTWGRQGKLVGLYAWTGARPVAVLDDEHGGKDLDHAQQRTAEGIPTLLVPVDGYTGLRRHDIDQVHAWLDTLPRPARPMPPATDPPRPTP